MLMGLALHPLLINVVKALRLDHAVCESPSEASEDLLGLSMAVWLSCISRKQLAGQSY